MGGEIVGKGLFIMVGRDDDIETCYQALTDEALCLLGGLVCQCFVFGHAFAFVRWRDLSGLSMEWQGGW